MAKTGIFCVKNSVEEFHKSLLKKSNIIGAGLARDVYSIYANAQRQRWMTENNSEGKHWDNLSEPYKTYKRKKFAQYPGGGSKMLVATGTLFKSVTGEDLTYHRRIVEKNSITISTTLPYAVYVVETRPFMEFSDKTENKIRDRLIKYYFYE